MISSQVVLELSRPEESITVDIDVLCKLPNASTLSRLSLFRFAKQERDYWPASQTTRGRGLWSFDLESRSLARKSNALQYFISCLAGDESKGKVIIDSTFISRRVQRKLEGQKINFKTTRLVLMRMFEKGWTTCCHMLFLVTLGELYATAGSLVATLKWLAFSEYSTRRVVRVDEGEFATRFL